MATSIHTHISNAVSLYSVGLVQACPNYSRDFINAFHVHMKTYHTFPSFCIRVIHAGSWLGLACESRAVNAR